MSTIVLNIEITSTFPRRRSAPTLLLVDVTPATSVVVTLCRSSDRSYFLERIMIAT